MLERVVLKLITDYFKIISVKVLAAFFRAMFENVRLKMCLHTNMVSFTEQLVQKIIAQKIISQKAGAEFPKE